MHVLLVGADTHHTREYLPLVGMMELLRRLSQGTLVNFTVKLRTQDSKLSRMGGDEGLGLFVWSRLDDASISGGKAVHADSIVATTILFVAHQTDLIYI